MIYGLPL